MRWTLVALFAGAAVVLTGCAKPVQVTGADPMTKSAGASGGATTTARDPSEQPKPEQPFSKPSGYADKSWAFKPDPGTGGSGAYLKVPDGWDETKRATYWSDFLDPTGQVRLRVDVTAGLTGEGLEQSPQAAADAELQRLAQAAGFKQVSKQDLPASRQTGMTATEIVYQFTRDGQTVQATFRFIGSGDVTEAKLGIYYPPDQQQAPEAVLTKVQESLQFAG